ncbi:hypothetical protein DI383_08805 [Flavobacteriaceae bacterium LYZ1037]|nr:hypothetical protein DI383_08805 [Flavobacteriaceae bacterium LYZ1037]
MAFYRFFLNKIILPVGDALVGGNYLKYIKHWKTFDKASEAALKTLEKEKLQILINYATTHVPYYRNLKISEISEFPILTKSILRERVSDLLSEEYDVSKLDKHHSSGSTGVQSFTYMTHDHKFFLRALQTHWWTWSGYQIGDPLLQFGISQNRSFVKRLKDIFYRCTYVKAFGLSELELKETLQKIATKKAIYIAGYPSVINELAKASTTNNISPDVKGVICFGDKLFNHYKENIHLAFGKNIRIIDTYGCAEGLLMACKYDLDYYYIMSPHVYLEIVDDYGSPVPDGQMGHVLVTCLTNYAMPIIRYKLGDLAIKLPKEQYPNTRLLNYPLLQKVVGRETDIVKTTKGITLNVHSFTGVLEYYQNIKQYKIIQNNLESIEIEYLLEPNLTLNDSVLLEIKSKLNTLTNNCLDITFKLVKEIKPTKSGKPQIIESNLKLK